MQDELNYDVILTTYNMVISSPEDRYYKSPTTTYLLLTIDTVKVYMLLTSVVEPEPDFFCWSR